MERKYSFLRHSYKVRNNDLCGGDHHPSVHLTISPSDHQSIWPSVHLSISPSVHKSIWPSVLLTISPSDHQSIWPSVHLTISPSDHQSSPSDHQSIWPGPCISGYTVCPIFIKLCIAIGQAWIWSTSRQLFVSISLAEFHGNLTNGLIADTRSDLFSLFNT
jgi:hypothetical protein